MLLKNKVAVVTGGASGFGEGIVKRFVDEGARVVIADINREAGAKLARTLGASVRDHATDVASNESVEGLAAFVHEVFGHADIVVNNAGMGQTPRPLESLSEQEFDQLVSVNVRSIYLTAKHFIGG